MKFTIQVIIIIFATGINSSFSQNKIDLSSTSFQSITVSDGLPSLTVNHIEEDELGFMYFCTSKGLAIYDGNNFFTYDAKTVDGFSNSVNYCKSLNPTGCIIATQDKGLFLYNKSLQKISKLNINTRGGEYEGLSDINTMLLDSKQNLWMGSESGELFVATLGDLIASINKEIKITKVEIPTSSSIHSIVEYNGEILIASLSSSIVGISGNQEYIEYRKALQLTSTEIATSLFINGDDELVLTSTKGLFLLKGPFDRVILESIGSIDINDLKKIVHFNKNYFVIQSYKLNIISDDGKSSLINNDLIPRNILCAHLDRHGRLWLGSWFDGVTKIDLLSPFQNRYKLADKHNETDVVWSLTADSINNTVYLGSFSHGLCKLDSRNSSYKRVETLEDPIWTLYKDSKSPDIYIGTWGKGVAKIDPKSQKISRLSFSEIDNERVLFIERKSDVEMWFGTGQKGLWVLNERQNRLYPILFPESFPKNMNVRSVVADPIRKGYWVGTYNFGLLYIELDKNYRVTESNIVNNYSGGNKIINLYLDEKRLWVCMSDGLSSVDLSNSEYQMKPFDRLKGCVVSDFLKTPEPYYWIATYEGLFQFDVKKDVLTKFMSEDIHYRLELFSDYIYSCTSNGVVKFYLKDILNKKESAYPYIYDISIDGKSYRSDSTNTMNFTTISDKIMLEASVSNINFKVSTLEFSDVKRTVFFRLNSVDDGWRRSDVGTTSISYSNIPAGDSEFIIRLDSPSNTDQERKLFIYKEEFWWRTTAFRSLCYLLLIVLIVLIINYFRRRSKRKMERQLDRIEQESNQELYRQRTRFFTNISHDIKTPLTLLLSPITDLIEQSDIPSKYSSQLKSMNINGQVLLNKINKVLKYRESEFSEGLDIVSCSLHQLVLDIVIPFKEYAQSKGINFEFHTKIEANSPIIIKTDSNKLESILENLILNAIKYTPNGGKCIVEYKIIESQIEFLVADSGTGIGEDKLPNIFNQFYRIADDDQGTGIGLYLVKLFIDQMGGEICVDSKEGVGTSFKFNIPIEFDHLAISDIDIEYDEESSGESDVAQMFVVDDNKDMCDYLAQIFSPYYQVTTFYDGSLAKVEIMNNLPDIVISDLMMASVGGIELCKYSKNNILTSHIPFIIISAKSDVETKTACFEAGADMFEGKPFTKKNLLARVSSLIRSRKLLKYKYKIGMPSSVHLENLDRTIVSQESLDEKFLFAVNEVLNRHLQDTDFPIEDLAKELSIRYEQLYRKIKTLTGLTVSNYIRSYRLNCAAELLKSNKYSVTEVLYSVGFNNPSYFTRSFKKQFGVLPSEYISDNELI